jgi:hypothetical protein
MQYNAGFTATQGKILKISIDNSSEYGIIFYYEI